MRRKVSVVMIICLIGFVVGCAATGTKPGQFQQRALQTREIQAPLSTTFKAATMVLVNHGYTIKHSDRETGLIVGEVTKVDKGERAVNVILWGGYGLATGKHSYSLTFNLIPVSDSQTTVRMNFAIDGTPADVRKSKVKKITDQYWAEIQKECMIEAGPGHASR
jgi:hypothetical protein